MQLSRGRCLDIAIRQCGSYSAPSFSHLAITKPDWATALLLSLSSAWGKVLSCSATVSPWPTLYWRHSYRRPRPAAEEIIYPIANDLDLDYGSKPNDASSRRVGS